MAVNLHEKPGRPFGVTLAIIASVLVFSFIPIGQLAMFVTVREFLGDQSDAFTIPYGDEEVAVGDSGGSLEDVFDNTQIILQLGMSLGFLVIAFFAWRGKPAFMRYVFMGTVLLLTVINLGLIIVPLLDSTPQSSGGSLDGLFASLQCGQLTLIILVPIYVVWYLNRGPARAFFRGHYLPAPETQA
ncbi:MAG: hypothetical protein RLP44_17690 [Aggregatilineales bacterium]